MDKGIKVKKLKDLPEAEFEVSVVSGTNTKHKITLDKDYYRKLTGGEITPEELIKRSFEFLLSREPNTSILSEFDLKDINTYFPEFEEDVKLK